MIDEPIKDAFKAKGKAVYREINNVSGNSLKILIRAVKRFSEVRATQAAAAITYFALFSLFPLLLFLIAIASSVLNSPEIQAMILDFAGEIFPASRELVEENIQQVLRLRGAVGVVGMVGLLWAATAVFSVMTQNISEAWQTAQRRNFFRLRLIALSIVASMVGLLILSLLFTTVTDVLSQLDVPLGGGISIYDSFGWKLLSRYLPLLLIFTGFLFLYWWGPNTTVRWQEAAWGALVATAGWELIKNTFSWYLSSGLARHRLVYGSLGAVVALMLWIYVSNLIILFGAHVSAAIAYYNREETKKTGP